MSKDVYANMILDVLSNTEVVHSSDENNDSKFITTPNHNNSNVPLVKSASIPSNLNYIEYTHKDCFGNETTLRASGRYGCKIAEKKIHSRTDKVLAVTATIVGMAASVAIAHHHSNDEHCSEYTLNSFNY